MTADWSKLEALPAAKLTDLFAADSERLSKLSLDVAGIHFDWSKTHLDEDHLAAFEALADASEFAARRAALFAGWLASRLRWQPSRLSSHGGTITGRTGRPWTLANSQSRWSCAGTAMTAPVP